MLCSDPQGGKKAERGHSTLFGIWAGIREASALIRAPSRLVMCLVHDSPPKGGAVTEKGTF
jgi:hypothetical protein